MSNFTQYTLHPTTGKWQKATWVDNYHGARAYGVKFPGDPCYYPVKELPNIKTFWVQDVLDAAQEVGMDDAATCTFLDAISAAYNRRWERDPTDGGGAAQWLRRIRHPNSEVFTIDAGIPPQAKIRPGAIDRYPLAALEVGDSFAFPESLRKKIGIAAAQLAKRAGPSGPRFTIRRISDTEARCWRIG